MNKKRVIVLVLIVVITILTILIIIKTERDKIEKYNNLPPEIKYLKSAQEKIKDDLPKEYNIDLDIIYKDNKYVLSSKEFDTLTDEQKYKVMCELKDAYATINIDTIKDGLYCGNDFYYCDYLTSSNDLYKNGSEIYEVTFGIKYNTAQSDVDSTPVKTNPWEKDEMITLAKYNVEKNLKNPKSAKYENIVVEGDVVYGTVFATNSFNATVSNSFAVIFDSEGGCTVDMW